MVAIGQLDGGGGCKKGLGLGIWERKIKEGERECEFFVFFLEWKFMGQMFCLFLKLLTSWVSFYGLWVVELEIKPKPEILSLTNSHPTRLGSLIHPWAFGSNRVRQVGRVNGLMDNPILISLFAFHISFFNTLSLSLSLSLVNMCMCKRQEQQKKASTEADRSL